MTASFTHCWKRARARLFALTATALLGGWMLAVQAQGLAPEANDLQLQRSGSGLELSAQVRFALPGPVEDALYKGVALIFVAEAEVFRERWYWLDRKVSGVQRQMRLVYQPLTRRWRLTLGSGLQEVGETTASLAQTFDTLDEAMAVIRRVSGWRIADTQDLEAGARHRVEFRFRLDVTQLPRPLQIGALGTSDWNLAVYASQRFMPESVK